MGRGADRNIERAGLTRMTARGHPPNQLLQMLEAADFNLPRARI